MAASHAWHVNLNAADAVAAATLRQDPAWTGYALADLDPPFRHFTQVALARHGTAPWSAAYVVVRHPAFSATVPYGDPAGLAALLTAVDLPEHTSLAVQAAHRAVLARYYRLPAAPVEMRRLVVTPTSFVPPPPGAAALEQLGPTDATALQDLYAGYEDRWFYPDQLHAGIFYGVRDGLGLVAAGGTQAVSFRYGVAAVGNIYTRPTARGRGLATAVTATVVADLLALGCGHIILNVRTTNEAAIRIYERLGFHERCRFWEISAVRRSRTY